MANTHRIRGIRRGRLANNRRSPKVATKNKTVEEVEETTGSNVANAVAAFLPLLRALVLEAEASGQNGAEKHAAVAEASEKMYRIAQQSGSIKELKYVPWALVAPIIVPAADGLIDIIVSMFNKLWGKVWSIISKHIGED
jgi:hypothetical protein